MSRLVPHLVLINLVGGGLLLGAGVPTVWAQFAVGPEYYNQRGGEAINLLSAFNQGYSGNGVNIGVVDTGIDPNHVEFTGKIVAGLGWSRDGTQWVECVGTTADCLNDQFFGHGSFVSSIAAATLDYNPRPLNIMGVAYNAKLVISTIKFPDDNDPTGLTDEQFTRAIDFVSAQGVKVINNSWGEYASWNRSLTTAAQGYLNTNRDTIVAAFKRAQDRGAVLVFAAGNASVVWPGPPATLPSVDDSIRQKGGWIVVAATTTRGFNPVTGQIQMAQTRPNLTAPAAPDDFYTNYCGGAANYCISAPGGLIYVPQIGDYGMVGAVAGTTASYGISEGTSFAAPLVTGAVALVAEKFPWMSSKNLGVTILTTGTTAANPSPIWGRGVLDVGKAMNGPGIFEEDFDANVTAGYHSTFANAISGPAGLIKSGDGTLVLTATNSYVGATTINTGTLALAGAGSIASSSGVWDYGTFDISGTTNGATIGGLFGNGVVVLGAQSLAFSGNGSLGTFVGTILGTGGLTFNGGYQALFGTNYYSGVTTVNGGTLAVNGSLRGPVNVGPRGTLRGTGILYAATTVSGTLAPGNSPGTLTTTATVTMNPGSTYREDIDGTGTANGANNYSRLLVTGAGSQFIANGTLRPLLRGIAGAATNAYTPALGDTFAVISAGGGIQGRFASVVQPPAGLAAGTQLDVFYNAFGNRRIDLIATPSSYGNYAWSTGVYANSQAAGGALDTLRAWDGAGAYNPQEVNLRYAVAGQRAAQIPGLLTALAGEVHGAMAAAAPATGRWLQNTVARHLDTTPDQGAAAGVRLWVELNAGEGRARGGRISSDYKAKRSHFAVGADLLQGPNYQLGLGVTYTDIDVSPGLGSGTIKETALFLYGQYALNTPRPVVVDGLLAYGFSAWRTNRSDPLGLAGGLSAKANGEGLSVGLGVRSPFAVSALRIEPFARLLWQDAQRGALNEGLTSPAGLVLAGYKQNGTRLLVGAILEPRVAAAAAGPWSCRASLAIGEDFGQLVRPTVSANLAGAGYTIDAPHVGRTFVQLDLSANYRVLKNAYVYGALLGEARTDLLDGGVSAGFNYSF